MYPVLSTQKVSKVAFCHGIDDRQLRDQVCCLGCAYAAPVASFVFLKVKYRFLVAMLAVSGMRVL
eukprot:snap_masked-scaffold_53-processed-gene-1.73-mRNA-1 protein AED:1.00 eAED:1.00 QI:0/0/0/0/1/1/2/0/64